MSPAPIRIVFLGTSDFAIPILEELSASVHDVMAAVTRPARRAGRGRSLADPPVAILAREKGLALFQPRRLDEALISALSRLAPDVMVSADYGAWLPGELLDSTRYGVVNVHPSLLPRHRGAAPVARTILDGDTETGVTFMLTDSGWDTGPVLRSYGEPVRDDDTAGALEARLALLAASKVTEVLEGYAVVGGLEPVPQSGEADYAEKLTTEETWLDWARPAEVLERMVRAFQPAPGARTARSGKLLKVITAALSYERLEPGSVLIDDGITVGCGMNSLRLLSVQPEGKRVMTACEFLRGSRIETGEKLGRP